MKLINPDMETTIVQESPLSKLPKKTLSELSMMKSRSRENIARLEDNAASSDTAFHVARPATVISSSSLNSSQGATPPATTPNNNTNNLVVSVNNKVPPPAGVNGAVRGGPDMDWTSLVDTATKAILDDDGELVVGRPTVDDMRRVMERVGALEADLGAERTEKAGLVAEVEHLKAENVRLQEESQTAAQQLRRFTEWFFQTIDKS